LTLGGHSNVGFGRECGHRGHDFLRRRRSSREFSHDEGGVYCASRPPVIYSRLDCGILEFPRSQFWRPGGFRSGSMT
jgi:hypothetical protein